jgi:hypothetical protein
MIGITLSSEQIRVAPADIRQWIEREVATSLGLPSPSANANRQSGEQLAACSPDEVATLLSEIQGVLPAVNVFFEFGRQGAVIGPSRVEAFRLLDIAHHTRLPDIGQVIACLDIINEALGRIRGDNNARFCGLDHEGHCFIAMETQQSILHLWQDVLAAQQLAPDGQNEIPSQSKPESPSEPANANIDEAAIREATAAVSNQAAAV